MNVLQSGHTPATAEKSDWPVLLTVDEAAALLRTTRRAMYAMVERRQLPGVVRIRRRVLFRTEALLDWVDRKSAPSPKGLGGPEVRAIAEGVIGDEREHQSASAGRVGRGHSGPAGHWGSASRTAKAERELLEDDGERVGRA